MDARRAGTADGAAVAPSAPGGVRVPSSLAECFWAAAMRIDLVAYLAGMLVAGLFMGGAYYVVPPLLALGIVVAFFSRLTQGEPLRAVPAALGLVALGAAPFVAAQLLDAMLRAASHHVPHAGLLVGAVAGWIVLPVIAAPAHWLRGRGSVWDALARALSASSERRRGLGTIAFGLMGVALGAVLVAGWSAAELVTSPGDLPNLLLALASSPWEGDPTRLFLLGPVFVPITMAAPMASATLAEQDDWLLAGDVAPPRPPIHAAVPLWVAVALMLGALATAPVPAWQPYGGDPAAVERGGTRRWHTLLENIVRDVGERPAPAPLDEVLAPQPVVQVLGPHGPTLVLGPRGGRFLGVSPGRLDLVFETEAGALVAVPLDPEGRRLDDGPATRLAVRAASPLGGAALFAAILLLAGTLALPRLRPGLLHRVLRPGRFELGGTIELDPGAQVTRIGRRVRVSGGVFRSDDGEVVLRVEPRVLVLGMDGLPAGSTRATLLSPARPAELSLRSGTAPFPASAVLLGLGEPRNAALGHEMHRSAVLPVLLLSLLATVTCVLLAATL